jgi:hypothetical protein
MLKALETRRSAIARRWLELVLATYPEQSRELFLKEKDRFRNPVGVITAQAVEVLLRGLMGQETPESVDRTLDDIVRIRSVQDFTPAEAVGFIFLLKQALRDVLVTREGEAELEELLVLHGQIDDLALRAFNRFMECREMIYKIRAREVMSRTYSLLRQAGALEDSEDEPGASRLHSKTASRLKGGCEE